MSQPVQAVVRYLAPEWKEREELARIESRASRRGVTVRHEMPIRDARALPEPPHLEREGFVLARLVPGPLDFDDAEAVERVYYPKVEALVRELTGAARVIPYQHVVRDESTDDFNNAYARFLHSDYSMTEGRAQVTARLEERGIEIDTGSDWEFAFYNTWQPIDWEVQQNPLALISHDSLADGDLCGYLYAGFGEAFHSTMPVHNDEHRIYYFPRMQTDEILVFKQLDTRPGHVLTSPHTSFDDPSAPEDALPRHSIETRILCVFPA